MIPFGDNVATRRFAVVSAAIIAINATVWLAYELPDPAYAVRELGFYPCQVEGACRGAGESWPLSVLTAMFTHASWLHIGGNMLFLWIFGNNVEDAVGRLRYGLFYLAAGVVATAAQTVVTLAFGGVDAARIPNVGASGAIAGVLGAYIVLYPRARVRTLLFVLFFFTFVEVPAVAFLGIWFLLQAWQGGAGLFAPAAGGGVAFFAHVGGFVFGMLAAWAAFRPAGARRGWRTATPAVPAAPAAERSDGWR